MKKEDEHGKMKQMEKFRGVLNRWFVQYNPLYFFSALCMLLGIFFVSPGLGDKAWQTWETVLTIVIELYQLLLITGAAILFRYTKQFRSAAILGLIATCFMFDTTFQTEVIATFDRMGLLMMGNWVIMAALKLVAIRWAFQLRVSWTVLAVPFLAVTGIAIVPHLFYRTGYDQDIIHLVAVWYGTGLAAFIWAKRPVIRCDAPLGASQQYILQRIMNAIWMIWAGLYLYHLIAWLFTFAITLDKPALYIAPGLLIFALLSRKEKQVWAGCAGTLFITLFQLKLLGPTACLVSIVFGVQAWRLKRPQLYIGAVLTVYIAVQTIGWYNWPLPEPNLWAMFASAGGLIAIAYHFHLMTALLPLLAGLFPIITSVNSLGLKGWGVLLIAMAFMTLIVGIAINWSQRYKPTDEN
ncbi:hypothetical protein QUF90_16830 [Desulfococcaceae bacterium HSG9]|nr:hypothetical protein [Desulfococcaceae bacterium HSG9]